MREIDSGGPAFPMSHEEKQTGVWGLTKREWFAGMALQGLIASGDANGNEVGLIVQESYKFADAMLRMWKSDL